MNSIQTRPSCPVRLRFAPTDFRRALELDASRRKAAQARNRLLSLLLTQGVCVCCRAVDSCWLLGLRIQRKDLVKQTPQLRCGGETLEL